MQKTPALTLTRTLAAATLAGTFVGYSGEVTPAGERPLGVTIYDGAKGDAVAVDALGTTIVRAGAAFGQGDSLQVGPDGAAVPAGAGAAIARAMQPANAAGAAVEIFLLP